MHNIFVTSAIAQQDSSILWIMLAVTYILLALIIADYFFLTCSDPVDDLLLGIDKGYKPT
jgi:flagellar basal body-associated protein FliL